MSVCSRSPCTTGPEKGLRLPRIAFPGAITTIFVPFREGAHQTFGPWQRGQFPLQENARADIPRLDLRTRKAHERVNSERKRRTRVASLFPNEASLLRLVSALLCEICNEWATSKIYLKMNLTDPPQA